MACWGEWTSLSGELERVAVGVELSEVELSVVVAVDNTAEAGVVVVVVVDVAAYCPLLPP